MASLPMHTISYLHAPPKSLRRGVYAVNMNQINSLIYAVYISPVAMYISRCMMTLTAALNSSHEASMTCIKNHYENHYWTMSPCRVMSSSTGHLAVSLPSRFDWWWIYDEMSWFLMCDYCLMSVIYTLPCCILPDVDSWTHLFMVIMHLNQLSLPTLGEHGVP